LLAGCGLSVLVHVIPVLALIRRPALVAAAPLDSPGVAVSLAVTTRTIPPAAVDPVDARVHAHARPRAAPVRPGPRSTPAPVIAAATTSEPPAIATGPLPLDRPVDHGAWLNASQAQGLRVYDEFPDLPAPLRRAGARLDVTATVCVSQQGLVTSVAIDAAGVPLLEHALGTAVRTWRYHPFEIDGRAQAFCHAIMFAYRMG
jgi:hypothetical protein